MNIAGTMLNEWKANDFNDHNSGKVATGDMIKLIYIGPGLVAVTSLTCVDSSFVSTYALLSINNAMLKFANKAEERKKKYI